MNLPSSGDAIAPYAMDLYSENSPSVPARYMGPLEVRDAVCSSRIANFGRLRCLPLTQEKGRCVEDPHLAFVVDAEVLKEYPRWRGPEMRAYLDATYASPLEGADAAISARAAARGHGASGQELLAEEAQLHGISAPPAKEIEPAAWWAIEVSEPVTVGTPSEAIGDTRWALAGDVRPRQVADEY